MNQPDNFSRSSQALPPIISTDEEERKRLEVTNHFRQYDAGIKIISDAIDRGFFKLRPSTILRLHREGFDGLTPYAGAYRPVTLIIQGSNLVVPEPYEVPELVEDMCDYVNARWNQTTAIHLSAYLMWRLNWIHPFVEGNGTTARTLSYIVLSIRLGALLPGIPTIPEQIAADRQNYFESLEAADIAWRSGNVDVSKMENLIGDLLANQLKTMYRPSN